MRVGYQAGTVLCGSCCRLPRYGIFNEKVCDVFGMAGISCSRKQWFASSLTNNLKYSFRLHSHCPCHFLSFSSSSSSESCPPVPQKRGRPTDQIARFDFLVWKSFASMRTFQKSTSEGMLNAGKVL